LFGKKDRHAPLFEIGFKLSRDVELQT